MEISSALNTIDIVGNIKSLSHYDAIVLTVENIIQNEKKVIINIIDSISITSSIIGYLNKIVVHKNIQLELVVNDSTLYALLDDLNLTEHFNVKKGKNFENISI